jgi:gamma-glutamyltranspeptidase / glutathione hydrolase
MRDFHRPGRSAVLATEGMAATSHPIAARVAIDTLRTGGNAVDAAIAAALVLGIAEPQMTGIGGDMFALVRPPHGPVMALNGSGRAPAALDPDVLRANGPVIPVRSVDAVTVPGAVDGFWTLHGRLGRMAWPQVLEPAIHYADHGIPVAPRVAMDWAGDAHALTGDARQFYLTEGRAPRMGEVFRAPGQAKVLRHLARDGRAGFYDGPVAEDMVNSLRAMGGTHTLADFAATEATWGLPVTGTYDGRTLYEHAPNGQGATAILILNMLAQFDLRGLDPFGAARIHLEAEATKLAYDARNRIIADPDHTARLDFMLSQDTARRLAALIDPARAMPDPAPLTEAMHRDTVYVTVVDRTRLAVSLIYSVFWGFGSGLASAKYGINFQNRGAGFCLTPGHPNEAGGGKRPMHTIIPAILKGDAIMPFGVMGGAYQATGHARFVTNLTDFGMDPQSAIDAPRAFSGPDGLAMERTHDPAVMQALAGMGHRVHVPDEPIGGAQAIVIHPSGVLEGASDPRKDGCALGY